MLRRQPYPIPKTTDNKRQKLAKWLVILVLALAIGVGLAEALHRGTAAFILSVIFSIAVAVWSMLRDVANACSEFIDYIKHQRS